MKVGNFNLQLFGTNDTVTASSEIALGFEREDETTQYIRLKNFKSGVTAEEARGVMTYLTSNKILLDSKTNEPLSETSILTAYTEEKQSVSLDLS